MTIARDGVWRDGEGRERRAVIKKPDDLPLGLDVDPLRMHACNNRCAFCFAHQNARGMRRALYFKDDDYRFSFLNGNFATLTNLTEADTGRIIEQRLSPLYISVHATDWALRNQILGNPNAPNILEQIGRFSAARIVMHTQVVLCPGINDGAHLARSLEDLRRFHPFVETVALVPVGLTQYREKLPVLRLPDRAYAGDLLAWGEPRRRRYLKEIGTRLAFPSDEFYLLAERPFPSARSYEGYAQLGNGVGGSRKFLEEFRKWKTRLPETVSPARRVTVVTAILAVAVLSGVIEQLNRIRGLLSSNGVEITAEEPRDNSFVTALVTWAPVLFLVGLWIFFMRQMQAGGNKALSFGKSKAKLLSGSARKVEEITIQDSQLRGKFTDGQTFRTVIPAGYGDLIKILREIGVNILVKDTSRNPIFAILMTWFPILLIVVFVDLLHAPDAGRREQGHVLRQEPGQAFLRPATEEGHVQGRRRSRGGQGRAQ